VMFNACSLLSLSGRVPATSVKVVKNGAITLSRMNFSKYVGHVIIFLVECFVRGMLFGTTDRIRVRVSVWLVVAMHTYLHYFPLSLSLSHSSHICDFWLFHCHSANLGKLYIHISVQLSCSVDFFGAVQKAKHLVCWPSVLRGDRCRVALVVCVYCVELLPVFSCNVTCTFVFCCLLS